MNERTHEERLQAWLDEKGEPGPCVVYSPDLSEVYSHHPGYNA